MKRYLVGVLLFLAACATNKEQNVSATKTVWKDVVPVTSSIRKPSSIDFIREVESAQTKSLLKLVGDADVLSAKARMEKMFEFARTQANPFFSQLRRERPIFSVAGASGKILTKNVSIPSIYLVTMYKDVQEVLDRNNVFTVRPYAQVMDATVGSPYMLGRDYSAANQEKPGMRHALYGKNDLQKVREIVRQIARRSILAGAKNNQIDIVKSVTRTVPLSLNDEYFGFNPPDPESMARWSRASQHAFFHNPFKDEKVIKDSIQAGNEMREYVTNVLVPQRQQEIDNGRPANDTVSQILLASKAHAKHGLQGDRIVANVMGLLVGSVETTSAAIAQSLQFIMDHPEILQEAIQAAQKGDDALLSKFVWEALRFDPVNPWLARYAEADYVIAKGTPREVTIPKGSLVLASTQSAMWDETVFPDPESFNLNRDQTKFMHLGYGYHRCLGDDVSYAMVPETIKQILLLNGLRKVSPVVDQKNGPFPESYVLAFDSYPGIIASDVTMKPGEEKNPAKVLEYLGLGEFVGNRIVNMEKRTETLIALKNVAAGSTAQKRKALYDLPLLVENGMASYTPQQKIDSCMNKNPKSQEAFKDVNDRRNYCAVRIDFRGCYFVQRLLGKQSAFASYYHCAYGRNFLTQDEKVQFKKDFAHLENFYFLNLE